MSHLSECPSSINPQTTSAGENVEEGEPLCTVNGMKIGVATVESSMEIPQNIKNGSSF